MKMTRAEQKRKLHDTEHTVYVRTSYEIVARQMHKLKELLLTYGMEDFPIFKELSVTEQMLKEELNERRPKVGNNGKRIIK